MEERTYASDPLWPVQEELALPVSNAEMPGLIEAALMQVIDTHSEPMGYEQGEWLAAYASGEIQPYGAHVPLIALSERLDSMRQRLRFH